VLENKASIGPDEIPLTVVKFAINYIFSTLSLITNHSLEKSVLPDALKLAKVVPLFKAGSLLMPATTDQFHY
jgi:hypothetical protein